MDFRKLGDELRFSEELVEALEDECDLYASTGTEADYNVKARSSAGRVPFTTLDRCADTLKVRGNIACKIEWVLSSTRTFLNSCIIKMECLHIKMLSCGESYNIYPNKTRTNNPMLFGQDVLFLAEKMESSIFRGEINQRNVCLQLCGEFVHLG